MSFLSIKLKILIVIQILVIFSYCTQRDQDTSSENYISISGRIINRETGKGIPGLDIEIFNIHGGNDFECKTDQDGNFKIENVPKGVYTFETFKLYSGCPKDLVFTEMPKDIDVSSGKSIKNLKIYLQRGAIISGYVYGPDGVTPLKNIELEISPWPSRVSSTTVTDDKGKYIFTGIEGGKMTIFQNSPGYEIESVCRKVKPGNTYENVNFILGTGKVSVKGKVVSAENNQVVTGAHVYFMYRKIYENYSSGVAETDSNGDYSLLGLKYPGTFQLSIVKEGYQSKNHGVELNWGENILDFILYPVKKIEKEEEKIKKTKKSKK